MSLKLDILTYLLTVSSITDIVGTRIYYDILPEVATLPAITFSKISNPRVYTQSGDSGHKNPRIQFSCWASTNQAAENLADTLAVALSAYTGAMGSTTIEASFVENTVELFEQETQRYYHPVDIRFRYNG